MSDRPVSPNQGTTPDVSHLPETEHQSDIRPFESHELLEGALDGFVALDRQWRITYVNRQAAEVAGMDRQNILGKVMWELFPETVGSQFETLCQRAIDENVPIRYETYYQHSNAWFEGHICPEQDGLTIHFRDITSRKQVETKLSQRERLLSSLVDSVNGILWEADGQTFEFSFVSHQAERILGYPAEQWISEKGFWRNHTHPDDVAWCTDFCVQATADRKDHDFEYRMIAADGRVVWIRDIVTVKVGPAEAVRLQGIMIDITARKLADDAARATERKWATVFDQAAIGIALVDSEGRPIESNAALREMLDYTQDELSGMTCAEFTHPDDVAKDLALFEDLHAGKRTHYQVEKRFIRKNGQMRWGNLVMSYFPAEDVNEMLGIGMVEDITTRKSLEEQLHHAQRMEAIGRLAGSIAHDFNNLLTAIIGNSNLVLSRLTLGDPLRDPVEEIDHAGKRAAALTGQLLAFSRKQAIQPRSLDLNAILDANARMIRRLIGEDVELVVDLKPRLGAIKADPSQIEQIVINLAVNARDAMPDGGTLSIRTADVEIHDEECYPNIPPGMYVMLSVSDTGVGMHEDVQARIFEPFFTTKEIGKGTGLGLSTVYGIVKQSGGDVRVSSTLGEGTTFRIFFPVSEEADSVEERPVERPPVRRGDETVLLVEDEDAVRRLTRAILEFNGYTVLEAANGPDAIRLGEAHPEPIDLLVSDVVMPRMNGRELADRLRRLRPELRVLYVSGYTDDEIAQHGGQDADVAFLQKPFTSTDLAGAVRRVLGK